MEFFFNFFLIINSTPDAISGTAPKAGLMQEESSGEEEEEWED